MAVLFHLLNDFVGNVHGFISTQRRGDAEKNQSNARRIHLTQASGRRAKEHFWLTAIDNFTTRFHGENEIFNRPTLLSTFLKGKSVLRLAAVRVQTN
jgi:hypothetical protein